MSPSLTKADMNYDSITRNFEWKVPSKFNFAQDVIDAHAQDESKANLTAFYHMSDTTGVRKWTFKEISQESKVVASGLLSLGTLRRAMLILPRIPEWWIVNIAAMRTDTVVIPGTTQLTTSDIERCYFWLPLFWWLS